MATLLRLAFSISTLICCSARRSAHSRSSAAGGQGDTAACVSVQAERAVCCRGGKQKPANPRGSACVDAATAGARTLEGGEAGGGLAECLHKVKGCAEGGLSPPRAVGRAEQRGCPRWAATAASIIHLLHRAARQEARRPLAAAQLLRQAACPLHVNAQRQQRAAGALQQLASGGGGRVNVLPAHSRTAGRGDHRLLQQQPEVPPSPSNSNATQKRQQHQQNRQPAAATALPARCSRHRPHLVSRRLCSGSP